MLKEMCADEDGDLLIESAMKGIPKVFVVATLISVAPAQPFIFRNYQYPAGTPEISSTIFENLTTGGLGAATTGAQVRKGGWRHVDTGQVLIESACSVDRVEEALGTLLPMLPDVKYFRFNPVDESCDMELDETDPSVLLKLESATADYIKNNASSFNMLCEQFLENSHDEKFSDILKSQQFLEGKNLRDETGPSLGWRKGVLLVEASNSPDSERVFHHARALETFCAHTGIRLSLMNGASGTLIAPGSAFPATYSSPLFTGSSSSSPLIYSPEIGPLRVDRTDFVPPLSLDRPHSVKTASCPPESPAKHRKLSLSVLALYEKLKNSLQVGVVHLALQNDLPGSILSLQNDVYVVAEPGELADKFLQSVKYSLLTMMQGPRRKNASVITSMSTVSDLVSRRPFFQIGGVVHRFIGRQSQVMEDDHEIATYMFRRPVPSLHLTPQDIRVMVGAWRDRIIIFTGIYGPTPALIKALVDSGAKAVICPSAEPEAMQLTSFGSCDQSNASENGKFEIGDEEAEVEETEPISSRSDWGSEPEENGERPQHLLDDDDDDDELSQFVC